MTLIRNAKVSSTLWEKKSRLLLSPLLLSAVWLHLWQAPSAAQLSQLPDLDDVEDVDSSDVPSSDVPLEEPDFESDWAIEDPVESGVPSVEVLDRRPTLDDLDPRIRTRSTPEPVEDQFEQYRLGPGDGIFVSVQRFPDLSFQATLDQEGNVILPIEGAISLEGLTLSQARTTIWANYNQYVKLPTEQEVDLTLTAQRGVEVIMLGEIERPGLYPLTAPRVTAALLAAGGARSTADLREVRIQRRVLGRDNQMITLEKIVDLYTPIRHGQPLPEERLENGDVVIVSRLDPAQAYDYDVNFVSRSTLAQPDILVRVVNYPAGNVNGLRVPNGSTFVDALVGNRGGGGSVGLPLTRANLRSVALIRFDPEQGETVVTKLNAKDAIYGDPTQNPPLRENDVIVVGRNFINRITFAIDTLTQPFQDVLSFVLFFDGIFDRDLF